MKFSIERDVLLKPLQMVQGVVERRQTLPILSNLLLTANGEVLAITATDMEVEMVARTELGEETRGEVTIPARKFIDICKSLPNGARIDFSFDGERVSIRSGRSRFNLITLPASEYPSTEVPPDGVSMSLTQAALRRLLDLTQFAMAHQDVRYYLNGLLLEIEPEHIRAIATDGHRLAMAELTEGVQLEGDSRQIIVPRKAVGELTRLLGGSDVEVELIISANSIRVSVPEMQLTSKLIDGRFPDYERVIPDIEKCDKQFVIPREDLRQSLARASILSNEKYRAVRLVLDDGVLRVLANNPEQEEAEDEIEVEYSGGALEIGFNVSYLMDALAALPGEVARIYLTDASSSCLIRAEGREDCQYVVMPMRL